MSKWFKKYRFSEGAKLRVFGFPYAGGSATVFAEWRNFLPEAVDLFAIQSPGRGFRYSEQPISHMKTLVTLLHNEILAYSDVPYLFVGHSNGALLAYELARELQKSGNYNLEHIILSAKRAPHKPKIKEDIHALSQQDFVARLRDYQFTPDEILDDSELMEFFYPMLKADFCLSETHEFKLNQKLEANLTLMWGNQDKDVPYEDISAWRELVTGTTEMIEFTDGHFFINTQKKQYVAHVNRIISSEILSTC